MTEAFARQLFKLMAYKDEYEVARLSIEPAALAAMDEQFGPGARVSYRLHPPVLRAMGMRSKLTLGPWFRVVFKALVAGRRLRATKLDPFRYAKVRRVERALIDEYCDAIDRVLVQLTPQRLSTAVQIAELPDLIRGYDEIKLAAVDRYRDRLTELQAQLVQR